MATRSGTPVFTRFRDGHGDLKIEIQSAPDRFVLLSLEEPLAGPSLLRLVQEG